MSQKLVQYYLDQLKSRRCACGGKKQPMRSFCWYCYRALPQKMQWALYFRIGQGYRSAYEAALDHLGHGHHSELSEAAQ
ncbi:MAG: hypothetical protein KJ621_18430 [Proteobacteria bacterium]|nr:hypothetical protein [Pseudomonadota bacterium]